MLYSNYYISKYIAVKMSEEWWKVTVDDMFILMKLLEYKCPRKNELQISDQTDPWKLFRKIKSFEIYCDFEIELKTGINGLSAVENKMRKSQNFLQYLMESFKDSR